MGKWLISMSETNAIFDQSDIQCNDKPLYYDDELDEFFKVIDFRPYFNPSNINIFVNHLDELKYNRCLNYAKFCNADCHFEGEHSLLVHKNFIINPKYPEQTILSTLLPGETIPEEKIRYFIVHKRIFKDKTEKYKIVGNDGTTRDISRLELQLYKNLIVNYADLKNNIAVVNDDTENDNRKKYSQKYDIYFQNSKPLGIPQPKLDYIFLGDEVIVSGINKEWLEELQNDDTSKMTIDLRIPEGVTKIAESAFLYTGNVVINSVRLSSTLKEIGNFAFFNNEELTSIDINGARLKKIGAYAFSGCIKLDLNLKIPREFIEFQDGVFMGCKSVNFSFYEEPSIRYIRMASFAQTYVEVEFPNTLKEIGTLAFCYSRFKNGKVILPDSVTNISEYAFYCSELCSIVLPNNLTVLSDHLFDFSCIEEIPQFPLSLKKIGQSCFAECEDLEGELVIPNSIEEIGEYAFFKCDYITKVTISSKLNTLASGLFQDCSNLKEVILNDNLAQIGRNAFYGCCSLPEIHIPSSVSYLFEGAFQKCDSLKKIDYNPDKLSYFHAAAFDDYLTDDILDESYSEILIKNKGVDVSNVPLKKGDFVVFFDCDSVHNSFTKIYGIFDHINYDSNPKDVVWILPKTIDCGSHEVDSKPILYEVKGLRPRKVIYNENNINQRIIKNYLCKCLNLYS